MTEASLNVNLQEVVVHAVVAVRINGLGQNSRQINTRCGNQSTQVTNKT